MLLCSGKIDRGIQALCDTGDMSYRRGEFDEGATQDRM